jgi:hypothetical protein
MTIRSRWWRVVVYLVAACFAAGAVGLLFRAAHYNRMNQRQVHYVGSGLHPTAWAGGVTISSAVIQVAGG